MEEVARIEPVCGHRATIWRYDVKNKKWESEKVRLMSFSPVAVARGGLRRVFRGLVRDSEGALMPVLVKEFIRKGPVGRYWEAARMQAEAAEMGELFNRVSDWKVVVLPSWVVEIGGKVLGTMEHVLEGKWGKSNDNWGGVGQGRASEVGNSFSHWTWEVSQGKKMVVDVQGDVNGGVYTDVVIHSLNDSTERFQVGAAGPEGMQKFFSTHSCQFPCAALGLPVLRAGVETPPGVGFRTVMEDDMIRREEEAGAFSRIQQSVLERWAPTVVGTPRKKATGTPLKFPRPRWTS